MPATLVIETSTPSASVALVGQHGEIEQREFTSDRNHNALLFEPLEELIGGVEGIGLVLVGSGPGSYSGTRVGIAAAQGVGLAHHCPVVAVPSILAVPAADQGATCLAIGDARRGSYWSARMRDHQLVEEPQLGDLDSLATALAAADQEDIPVVAFEAAERFPVEAALQSRIRLEHPDATRLWQAWQASLPEQRQQWQAQAAQPIYLKPPHITPGKRPRLIQD